MKFITSTRQLFNLDLINLNCFYFAEESIVMFTFYY